MSNIRHSTQINFLGPEELQEAAARAAAARLMKLSEWWRQAGLKQLEAEGISLTSTTERKQRNG
jgi:hypothetical protein